MKMFINLIVAVFLLLPQGVAALCVQGDCVNGQGTVVLPDGRRYVGEFQNGIRTGRGLMTFPDGTKYLGDWHDDKPHGQGTLSAAGKFEYAGGFANGVREGQGTLETVDGKKYSGQWQNDIPHGPGRITYPDGTVFIGQFENGRRNGQGEAKYKNGTKYVGQWKDDLPNGHGTKITVDGEKYTGEFRNGLMHGRGTVVKPDGSSYAGQWQGDVLMQKEEVLSKAEFSSAEETAGHVLAVVDEESDDVRVASSSEIMQEEAGAASTVTIINADSGFASVKQNGVFVRSGPSTEHRIIRSVGRGFPVQVIGQQDNWSSIRDFVGQPGWIYTPLLGQSNSVIVNASKVNLRSGPGLNFTVAHQIDFGTVLHLSDIQTDWYKVSTSGGMEGWLSRELIWPAGHTVIPSREVAAAAAISQDKAIQPVRSVKPVMQQKNEAAAEVFPSSGAAGSAESPAIQETMAVARQDDKAYAGIAQNGKGANIRSEPTLDSEVLRSVPPGYPLALLESRGEWVLVEDFRDRKGWVYAALLSDIETVVIKVGKGNLRSGPSLMDEVVIQLDYGSVLHSDETRGDWLKVSNPDGLVGWLHRDVVWP